MHIDIRALRYFSMVAEEGNISAAAKRLHMSQPPLTQQIQKLEDELGVQLLTRQPRGVALTAAGAALAAEAQLVMGRLAQAIDTVQQIGRGELGQLHMGIISSAMWGDFPATLVQFQEAYPKVKWTLKEMAPAAQLQAMREKRIDLGFWRPTKPQDDDCESVLVGREAVGLAVSTRNPLARRKSVALADLAQTPFVNFDIQFSDFAAYLHTCCVEQGFTPQEAHVAVEPQTLLALVGMDVGVALLPMSLARIQWPGVVFVGIKQPAPRADLYAFYRRGEQSPVVKAMVQLLRSKSRHQ